MFNWLFKKVVTFREKVAVDLGEGDVEKPFLDHLDDLRTMIVRMVVTLLAVTIVTFVFIEQLMAIIRYPLTMAGIAEYVTLQNLKPTGGFMTAMNIALVAGVIISFPVLLYFLLQFVLPGLRNNEKKVLFPALGVGGGLFLLGVVFAYFVVTPRALTFFYEFSRDIGSMVGTAEKKEPPPDTATAATPAPTIPPGAQSVTVTLPDGKTVVYVRCCESCTCGMPVDAKVVAVAPAPPASMPPAPGTPEAAPPASEDPSAPAPSIGTAEPAPATATAAVAAVAPAAAALTPTGTSASPFIWELTEYVKFICQFILIFGACFELPVVVMALVKLDVLNYKVMKGSRAWAGVIICVVAAIITPTQDALTLALLAGPMYILYEICIWLAWWLEKRDRALYPEYYKEIEDDAKALEVSDDWDNENYNPWGGGDEEDEDEAPDVPGRRPKPESSAPATSSDAEIPAPADEGDGSLESAKEADSGEGESTEPATERGDATSSLESSQEAPDPGGQDDGSNANGEEPGEPTADKRDTD